MWRLGEKSKSRLALGAKIGAGLLAGFVGQKVSDAGERASMSAFNEREEQKQRARYEAVKQPGGGIIPQAPTPGVSTGYSGVVVPPRTPMPPKPPTPGVSTGYTGKVATGSSQAKHPHPGIPWERSVAGRQEYLGQQQGARPYFGGV
jgi:hypothetical protein